MRIASNKNGGESVSCTLDRRAEQSVTLRAIGAGVVFALMTFAATLQEAQANAVVVSHDINTLGSFVAGAQESAFAINVAGFLTAGSATKNLLLFESNPGDGTRNFAPGVLSALSSSGFSVTVTSNYATPYLGYDAVFVAQDYPTVGFLDNASLTSYVNGGGSVYLAGGVGPSAANEAAGWSSFLNNFGLAFVSSGYNGINSVAINSSHPIFSGITALRNGNGQSILDLGTNPNAHIVQFAGTQGVYAVVSVPEPATITLLAAGLAFLGWSRRGDLICKRGVLQA